MVQTTKRAAIYARVSTDDQSCDRQLQDLSSYAARAGYQVIQVFQETGSGAKNDRKERAKVMQLARERHIDVILVTELSRWGRSTTDLLDSVQQLAAWNISLIAQTGLDFDVNSPTGKLMLTIMAGLAEFERGLLTERVKSGMNAAKARGKHVGRPEGTNTKQASKIMRCLADGLSVRAIAEKLGISKTTVMAQKKRAAV